MSENQNRKLKHKVTLSQKLIRIIAIVLVFILTSIIFLTYKGLDVLYLTLAGVESFFATYEIEEAYNSSQDEFFSVMDSIERDYAITVEIYSSNGDFVYSSSYKGAISAPPYNKNTYIIPDSAKKNYEVIMDLGQAASNTFNLSRDTQGPRNTEYLVGTWNSEMGITIKVFKVKTTVDNNARLAVVFVAFVSILASACGFIAISIIVKRITKPLGKMSEITKNMSSLDFSQKCEPNDVAEIALLADSINEMSESLETSLDDLRQKNEKLQDDIEQEKTIDRLRKVFISGVSHELKTPIAIIQGYSEGLKVFLETDPETAKKYCDTIISETERMNSLVMKLLDIIKYESGEYKLMFETFNIHDVIETWIERNHSILDEKGINAINDIDKNLIGIGDLFILSTVVNNYMSNAVSHVDSEMLIRASAKEIDNDRYRVSIFNTGEQIAPKDIDQIWNSFYRADKSMSRAQGRFGLGLAIVASIQKLHEQEYGVINHDNGVEFWFDVKKD